MSGASPKSGLEGAPQAPFLSEGLFHNLFVKNGFQGLNPKLKTVQWVTKNPWPSKPSPAAKMYLCVQGLLKKLWQRQWDILGFPSPRGYSAIGTSKCYGAGKHAPAFICPDPPHPAPGVALTAPNCSSRFSLTLDFNTLALVQSGNVSLKEHRRTNKNAQIRVF